MICIWFSYKSIRMILSFVYLILRWKYAYYAISKSEISIYRLIRLCRCSNHSNGNSIITHFKRWFDHHPPQTGIQPSPTSNRIPSTATHSNGIRSSHSKTVIRPQPPTATQSKLDSANTHSIRFNSVYPILSDMKRFVVFSKQWYHRISTFILLFLISGIFIFCIWISIVCECEYTKICEIGKRCGSPSGIPHFYPIFTYFCIYHTSQTMKYQNKKKISVYKKKEKGRYHI